MSAPQGACIDGHGQLLCQDGIQKPWMAWWVGTHASSRTPRYHYGYPYERETENRAYAKVRQQNLMDIYTNLCASKWLSVASTVIIMALQKGKEKVGMDRCQGLTRALMVPRLSSFIIPITDQSFRQEEQWGTLEATKGNRLGSIQEQAFISLGYIIWLISAYNCVMISHVLWAGQTGQNDEDQVLWFDCVREPKNLCWS